MHKDETFWKRIKEEREREREKGPEIGRVVICPMQKTTTEMK